MTQGFVTITEVKCLLVGPAGVGKTCLKFLLLSKPPPTNRTSTACQDRPVRVVRVGKLEDKWKEIDISHLRYMIAQSIPLLIDNLVDVSPENLLSSMDSCLSTSTAESQVRPCQKLVCQKLQSYLEVHTLLLQLKIQVKNMGITM